MLFVVRANSDFYYFWLLNIFEKKKYEGEGDSMKLLGLMKGVVAEVERKNEVSHVFLPFFIFYFFKIHQYTCHFFNQ